MNLSKRLFLALAAAGALTAQTAAQAQTPEDFYKGRAVTLVVAAAPGGMADSVARGFSTILQKHIPGNPDIVIQNMPGAGGIVGGAHIMNAAEADGSVIGFLLPSVVSSPLVTGNAQFDPRRVGWLGAVDSDDYPYALYAFGSSPVQAAVDLFDRTMVVGSTSFSNNNRIFPAMMKDYAGMNFEIVSGYKGSGEVYLAMERGEVDGWFEGSQTLRLPIGTLGQFIAEGRTRPILLMASARDARHPDLPIALDFIKDPDQRAVAKFIMDTSAVGRPIVAPEGVPEDRLAALRQAVTDTFADPALETYMSETVNAVARLQTSEEIEQIIAEFYATPETVLDTVRGFMVEK